MTLNLDGGDDDFDTLLPECQDSILDQPIAVTRFPTQGATRKTESRISLRQLAAEIKAVRAGDKGGLPWFKLAQFGGQRTQKNCLRSDANVLRVTGVEADYDDGNISPAEAERRMREAGIAGLIYTTASHTEQAPRWRVFAPFASAHEPETRTRYMERLNGVLGGTLDGSSFTLSQSYYGGNVDGRPPIETRLIDGRPIDQADHLDATALPKGKRRDEGQESARKDETGSGALWDLAYTIYFGARTFEDFKAAVPLNERAADHVARQEKAGKGRGDRAINRAWDDAKKVADERIERERDDYDDVPPISPVSPATRLRFLSPGECADAPTRSYIVKGLLAAGDVGCIYGAPGAGKSLISPHLGYAVAQGRGAFGMRTKAGRVFYVAAEDPHGMRGRVSALKLRHGDADDFTLVEGVSDLLTKGSLDLAALLSAVEEHKPSLIFIDTLAMAFPGLEENSAEDMGRVVAIARRLASHGAAVVLIHHDTKAGTPTPRGHSLLNGALDVALQLFARDEQGIVRGKLSKNRNGACDRDVAFRIDTEVMGVDEDGDPITYALVDELDAIAAPRRVKLTASERAAFDALQSMRDGEAVSIDESDWRERCIDGRAVSSSGDRDSRKRAFNRALSGLVRKGLICSFAGQVQLPNDALGADDFDDAFDGAET